MGAELGGETWERGEDGRSLARVPVDGAGIQEGGIAPGPWLKAESKGSHLGRCRHTAAFHRWTGHDGCLHRLGSYIPRSSPGELARFSWCVICHNPGPKVVNRRPHSELYAPTQAVIQRNL